VKTIQLVGAGTSTTGNNTSVTPGAPAWVPGDLVIIVASIRNSGTGKVNTPAGWKSLVQVDNTMVMARSMLRGDAMPLVTFSGGAANADTMASAFAVRFASSDLALIVHAVASQANAAAQDIATPALAITRDGCLVVNVGWKQDDATAVTKAGFTSMTFASSTAGNDASTAMLGKLQTTAANEAAGTLTVTGGAAATSYGITMALLPYVTTYTTLASADSSCGLPAQLAAAADQVGAALAALSARISTVVNRDVARVSSPSGTLTVQGTIPWKSVDIDPNGIADLVKDPYSVPASEGVWVAGTTVHSAFSGTAGNALSVTTDPAVSGSGLNTATTHDLAVASNPPSGGPEVSNSIISQVYPGLTSDGVTSTVRWQGLAAPAETTLLSSYMYLYRISD
jgi:hypothetical protein